MSDNSIRVVAGPANYFAFPGAIDQLAQFYSPQQLSKALWVYGERALAAAKPWLPAVVDDADARRVLFNSHCSESTVQDIVRQAGADRQVVIGVGGFLGIGQTRVRVLPSQFTVTADNKVLLTLTKSQLETLPKIEK